MELDSGTLKVEDLGGEESIFSLTEFAARLNPKRGFLFVSTTLGRYQPVCPTKARSTHHRLAKRLPDLPEPVVFLGIAEAGLTLAHGIFDCYRKMWPKKTALYLHTTRHIISADTVFDFEEVHSHAPTHRIYQPSCTELQRQLERARCLVVVDDEITTGNTFRRLAKQWSFRFPRVQACHHLVVTSWMEGALPPSIGGTELHLHALSQGRYQWAPRKKLALPQNSSPRDKVGSHAPCSRWGRVGLTATPDNAIDAPAKPGERVLIVGLEEHQYRGFSMAERLKDQGVHTSFISTTRAPVQIGHAIRNRLVFDDAYGEQRNSYLYNVRPSEYDRIFIAGDVPPPSLETLRKMLHAELC